MANSNTDLRATQPDGNELSVRHTTTDSPLLPAANLQQLQQIDPALVKWVVDQTEFEANHRRAETTRVNSFVFAERISGVIAGAVVAIFGLAISGFLIFNGHDWPGVALGGATLATIVTVLVHGRKPAADKSPISNTQRKRPR